ncbi:MAG: RHS repeat protein [Clostridiaceae bacterium]|nr:RHS repeat protein [Clostridiaceae bacterium]
MEKTIVKGVNFKEYTNSDGNITIGNAANDLTTRYIYDTAGRLVKEVSPQSYMGDESTIKNWTVYTYYKDGKVKTKGFNGVTKKYDPVTKTFIQNLADEFVTEAYLYDENGNLIKKVDGEAFSKAGGATADDKISNAYGVKYGYTLANQLQTVETPEFEGINSKKYTYDGVGRVLTETTANGINKSVYLKNTAGKQAISGIYYSTTRYAYDDTNLITDVYVKGADNVERKIKSEQYDYTGRIKKSTDGNGNITTYEYNDFGKARKIVYPGDAATEKSIESNTVEYRYDAMGNTIIEKNSIGNYIINEYNAQNRLISKRVYGTSSTVASKETKTRYLYDLSGNLIYEIDANNVLTKYEYDKLGRVIGTIVEDVGIIDPATGNISTRFSSTHETYNVYNKDGNILNEIQAVTEKDSSNNTTKKAYQVYSYEYDGLGRLVRKSDPEGNDIEKINYNFNSAQTESYDGEGHVKYFTYNRDGKLYETKDKYETTWHTERLTYDIAGNIAYKEDGKGNETVYLYDALGNLTDVGILEKTEEIRNGESVYEYKELTHYTYDNNGNMLTQKYTGEPETTYYYNARNLLMKKQYPGTVDNIEKYYYYKDGTLREKRDRKNIKTTYKYYPQGWLNEERAAQMTVDGMLD